MDVGLDEWSLRQASCYNKRSVLVMLSRCWGMIGLFWWVMMSFLDFENLDEAFVRPVLAKIESLGSFHDIVSIVF